MSSVSLIEKAREMSKSLFRASETMPEALLKTGLLIVMIVALSIPLGLRIAEKNSPEARAALRADIIIQKQNENVLLKCLSTAGTDQEIIAQCKAVYVEQETK